MEHRAGTYALFKDAWKNEVGSYPNDMNIGKHEGIEY